MPELWNAFLSWVLADPTHAALTVMGCACIVVGATPTPDPETHPKLARIYTLIEFCSGMFGKAKDTGSAASRPPASRAGTALAALLAVGLAAGLSACAVQKIATEMTPQEQARSVCGQLLDAYQDTHAAYLKAYPELSPDKQAQADAHVAPALDKAKVALEIAARAAVVWSEAAPENEPATAANYRAAFQNATLMWQSAQTLWNGFAPKDD